MMAGRPRRHGDTELDQGGVPHAAGGPRIPDAEMARLIAQAARAPSLHNSQPWRFRVAGETVELRADPQRQLRQADPDGREMLISCGAALFGLRLGLRRLGFWPVTEILPDPGQPALIARVRAGPRERATRGERDMIAALTRRHTHRGPFGPGQVPQRLLEGMTRDAGAEAANLVLLNDPGQIHRLARLAAGAQARCPPRRPC